MNLFEEEIDLPHIEAGQIEVNVEADEALQFDRQQLLVPAGGGSNFIVGDDVSTLVRLAEVRDPARWHGFKAQQLGSFHTTVPGYDLIRVIDQDGVAKAKLLDALGDLTNLLLRMRPGVVHVRSQVSYSHEFDFHRNLLLHCHDLPGSATAKRRRPALSIKSLVHQYGVSKTEGLDAVRIWSIGAFAWVRRRAGWP
jgi:hypothetical protein